MERLRKKWKRDYSYRFASVMHHATTQVSLKIGLNKFKDKGEMTVYKELLQLQMKITRRKITAWDLTDR